MHPAGSEPRKPAAWHRFARWLLPPHRKDWGEAMLNEMDYLDSRRAAFWWLCGCLRVALRERVAFELRRTFMTRRIAKVALGLCAVLVVGMVGIYIDAKPYQRERMWIAVHDAIHPDDPRRPVRGRDPAAPEAPGKSL